MQARLEPIKKGWAAHGQGWAVHGETQQEAIDRFRAAERRHAAIEARPAPDLPSVISPPGERSPSGAPE
jgi:hypothetical protein